MAGSREAQKSGKGSAPATGNKHLRALAGYLAGSSNRGEDRLLYERVRLGIMSALAVNRSLPFSELRDLLEATDGNLSVHARKLEDAGYISCTKSFKGRKPRTEYRLSAAGRRALDRYLEHMEALIRATRER